jgi:hypothetical protein
MLIRSVAVAIAMFALAAPAFAAGENATEPPGGDYKKVASLVALPEFIPGLGSLYVQPSTLPAGPFLAYDKGGKLVSTIYMVPLADLQAHKKFDDLGAAPYPVRQVDFYYNAGHPGVETPHYHVVLWHVDPSTAMLK